VRPLPDSTNLLEPLNGNRVTPLLAYPAACSLHQEPLARRKHNTNQPPQSLPTSR
jgi:hypothetical protein